MRKRSVGVTIFAILFIVLNALGLVSLMAAPHLLRDLAAQAPELQTQVTTTLAALEEKFAVSLTLALAGLAAGVGLLFVQRWAWMLTLAMSGVSLVWTAVNVLTAPNVPPEQRGLVIALGLLPAVVWNGLVIWYFLRASVKAQFAAQPANRPTG